MKGRVYDPLAGRFMTADPITQAPFWSQGLNRYSYVFNNPINNTDPSGFSATDSGIGIMVWGAGVTAMAAGGFAGLGMGALSPVTSAFMPSIGDGSAGSTHSAAAPSAAPKGGLGGRDSAAGAPGQIGQVGNAVPRRPPSGPDQRLAFDARTFCTVNPRTCVAAAEVAVDVAAPLLRQGLIVAGIVLYPAELGDLPPPPSPPFLVYRAMRAQGLLPSLGSDARSLGARPGVDFSTDPVGPGPNGISVSPGSPLNIRAAHRRPPEFGGTGKDPIWALNIRELPIGLKYVPDPKDPTGHGFISPATSMPFATYQSLVQSTAPAWVRVFP
jgi:hypothetical protein